MVVKHTRPSDYWTQALTLGTPSSHWANFHESERARVLKKKAEHPWMSHSFPRSHGYTRKVYFTDSGSCWNCNSSIFILPLPSKKQKLQLLRDSANYFGSIHMYILIVRCKPILKTFWCEKTSTIELIAKNIWHRTKVKTALAEALGGPTTFQSEQ